MHYNVFGVMRSGNVSKLSPRGGHPTVEKARGYAQLMARTNAKNMHPTFVSFAVADCLGQKIEEVQQ